VKASKLNTLKGVKRVNVKPQYDEYVLRAAARFIYSPKATS
jgi:hypothetical protein